MLNSHITMQFYMGCQRQRLRRFALHLLGADYFRSCAAKYSSMIAIRQLTIMVLFIHIWFAPIALASDPSTCFYLDERKAKDEIMPVVFIKGTALSERSSIRIDKKGLFQGDERLCQWSLNGGSGTKEQFSLDGDITVPILDPSCEMPFSHEFTGVGFGDWYLILCGTVLGENLHVSLRGEEYFVPLKSLKQWTSFTPGEFPIKGDKGD